MGVPIFLSREIFGITQGKYRVLLLEAVCTDLSAMGQKIVQGDEPYLLIFHPCPLKPDPTVWEKE